MPSFVTYSNYEIILTDPVATFGIIFAILFLLIGISCKKNNSQFFDVQTTASLRGVAILFLLFGHLSIKCLKHKMFFNFGGYWAVIIFLFLSGYGLYQRYQLSNLDSEFWKKRISKLYIPLWITLILFILLDHLLIDLKHPLHEIILNFMGFHLNDMLVRVNAAAWFVEYIMVLYIIYYTSSKMPFSENIKLLILFLLCIILLLIVSLTPMKKYHSIWIQYALVFPVGVMFGKYHASLQRIFPVKIGKQIMLLLPALISLLFFFKWDHFVPMDVFDIFRPLALIVTIILLSSIYTAMNFKSTFLIFLGNYSYEIYLLHGPFMVKYDFFLFRNPLYIYFFIYFILLIFFSYLLSKITAAKIYHIRFTEGCNKPTTNCKPQTPLLS